MADQRYKEEIEYRYYVSFVVKGGDEFWFRNTEYITDAELDELYEINHLRKLIIGKDPHFNYKYYADSDVMILGITYLGKQSRSYLEDLNRFEFADPHDQGDGNGFQVNYGH